jgi:hypothetical protein
MGVTIDFETALNLLVTQVIRMLLNSRKGGQSNVGVLSQQLATRHYLYLQFRVRWVKTLNGLITHGYRVPI